MPDIEAIKAAAHAEGEKAGLVLATVKNLSAEQERQSQMIAANTTRIETQGETLVNVRLKLAAMSVGGGLGGGAVAAGIIKILELLAGVGGTP